MGDPYGFLKLHSRSEFDFTKGVKTIHRFRLFDFSHDSYYFLLAARGPRSFQLVINVYNLYIDIDAFQAKSSEVMQNYISLVLQDPSESVFWADV